METQFLISTILPLSLGIIMLGFGLSLKVEDFKRIFKYPKSVLVGLSCQVLIIPIVAIFIAKFFNFSPELSVGMMILAASPGGVAANIFSHLAHGDIALNLTLTAISSVLGAFTLPLFVNFAVSYFEVSDQTIGLQFMKSIEVFMIVILPVGAGMVIHHFKPDFSKKMDKPVRIFSVVILLVIIVGAIIKERAMLMDSLPQIGLAMVTFNLLSMSIGFGVPKLLKLSGPEATAIAMEVGIHNSTISFFIALSVLKSFTMALPSAIYSIVMFLTAALFSVYLAKKNKA
ncbi:MAG: bile acid:sodium symporter family protein [Bacteriovoracaceae bacterium]|nr:bile acid:sodium symporter family protein [Bacteriovoracaceae bacterium]